MKHVLVFFLCIVCIALGVIGTLFVQQNFLTTHTLSASTVHEELSACSELATTNLNYRGLVRYEDGDIDFLTKKGFTMIYDSKVRAGVDLDAAEVEVSGRTITVKLPAAQLFGVEIDADSIEFYDNKFALFNWENKQDTAEALKLAQEDAESKVDKSDLLEKATEQARTLVETLLKPLTVGEEAYVVKVVTTPVS